MKTYTEVKIHKDLLNQAPELLDVMNKYFDSVEELVKEDPDIHRFAIQGKDIPAHNTEIVFMVEVDKDGNIKIKENELK